eukprot:scaffold1697_cov120-Cylindrotheca_fusiformis.AAC.44
MQGASTVHCCCGEIILTFPKKAPWLRLVRQPDAMNLLGVRRPEKWTHAITPRSRLTAPFCDFFSCAPQTPNKVMSGTCRSGGAGVANCFHGGGKMAIALLGEGRWPAKQMRLWTV